MERQPELSSSDPRRTPSTTLGVSANHSLSKYSSSRMRSYLANPVASRP
ncbi:hypothetical protein ACFFX0_10375 [Citricoccus parietis]|uniref:Uncharacterized protein n=1 Tax=Citricoccus parietis TaxID=592307 RepID=A0ABV5FY13_9MICC